MFSKHVLNRHFARHYAQMVVAMFVGMIALGIPAGWALSALGSGWEELRQDAPAAMLGLMAVTMTAPMSAWMYRMGHGVAAERRDGRFDDRPDARRDRSSGRRHRRGHRDAADRRARRDVRRDVPRDDAASRGLLHAPPPSAVVA